VVNSEEHQAFRWTSEEELAQATFVLKSGEEDFEKRKGTSEGANGAMNLVSEGQRGLMLAAFALHNADLQSIGLDGTEITTILNNTT